MRIMKNIEIEDIFIAITESAKSKIKFIFSEDEEEITYISGGREYGEYDVPIWITLSGLSAKKSLIEIYHHCVFQMMSHGLSPDAEKLNQIVQNVIDLSQDEIVLADNANQRINDGESPARIYEDLIKTKD